MSIDARAIADKTGVAEEDVLAVLDALDDADGNDADRTAVESHSPKAIMDELERFLDERDIADKPVFDPSGGEEDVYAREHVDNLKQLTTDRE
jgi:hypothetical protein